MFQQYLMEILSIASLLFLIILVGVKCLIAHKVHSRAMRTDGNNKYLANLKYTEAWSMTKVLKNCRSVYVLVYIRLITLEVCCVIFPTPSKSVHFSPRRIDRGKM